MLVAASKQVRHASDPCTDLELFSQRAVLNSSCHELIKDVEISLALPLSQDAALLQQVRLNRRPVEVGHLPRGKSELEELPKSRRVVVAKRPRVAEGLEDRRRLEDPLLQIFVWSGRSPGEVPD